MNISYWFIIGGIGLILIGLLISLGVPFGKLPGDIHIKSESTNIYIPIVTSILISIVLTILLNIFFWLFRVKCHEE